METVAFCEWEEFPQRVLKKHWPHVLVYGDIKELTYERLQKDKVVGYANSVEQHSGVYGGKSERGETTPSSRPVQSGDSGGYESGGHEIDLICGGFPCQPFSTAGKQRAQEDDRHLWPEMFRLIRECQPTWVIGENVAGLINLGLDEVCADLEGEGYSVQPFVIPACAIGAPHRRDRLWIIACKNGDANANRIGSGRRRLLRSHQQEINQRGCKQRRTEPRDRKEREPRSVCQNVADPCSFGSSGQGRAVRSGNQEKERDRQECRVINDRGRTPKPGMGRGLDGIPAQLDAIRRGWLDGTWEQGIPRVSTENHYRKDRLKAYGNAVVPQVVQVIGEAIMGHKS